ncbi:hypothetical protein, conserved [Plasmodium gonderi]|uniref:Serine aminopeptidase S33 domain-containing protein n=1 Tax=Plasmodium gonderi TaxID=77519 RepID=A0A1Y1JHL5_PLAGO|nr:hypothetical protein, conserved [Plasmodium gonderi]GAW81730.1 hypothetical protein, conserved [Plasmodium gonderi]
MFFKETHLANYKNKKNGLREVTQKCLNIIDFNYHNITSLISKNNSGDLLISYQFSDDEIKFDSNENLCSNDIYFPESSYTNNDFKNLLGWVPRNLELSEPTGTDSIPCAFFFSENQNKGSTNNKIILYLHKFNEDLGTIIPTINALHNKLKMNIIAMEYSGYGASFDTYEQKLISIVNDSFTILKFIVNFLKIPYSNIYILCYDFLASSAIEVVNRYEHVYGKNEALGGLVLIKPQLLQIVSQYTVPPSCKEKDDIVLINNDLNNVTRRKEAMEEYTNIIFDETTTEVRRGASPEKDIQICSEGAKYESNYSYAKESNEKNPTIMATKKWYQYLGFQKGKEILHHITRNSMKKNSLIKKGGITNSRDVDNKTCNDTIVRSKSYKSSNGIMTCDMSLFYSDNSKYIKRGEDNEIPNSLMKRILKDTFDMNHSINSIKSISCSILIFHPENYSYKNSSSYILLSNAKECKKKAAFLYDFMNEDFITAFKWFFSDTSDSHKKDKLFKNLLYLYIHPSHNRKDNSSSAEMKKESNRIMNNEYEDNICTDLDEICNSSFDLNFPVNVDGNFNEPHNNSVKNSFTHGSNLNDDITSDCDNSPNFYMNKYTHFNNKNSIHIPNEIFICPEIIQEEK